MNSRDHNTPKLKRRKYLPLLHRYAVTFNGVDEYLTLSLPNNDLLATPGVGDFYSSGSAIAGWDGVDVIWNSGVSGKTYAETITIPADKTLAKTIVTLIVGQKYKFKCRYQAGTDGLSVGSGIGTYFVLPDTFGEWNTVSKIFTAESALLTFDAPASGACTLDWASVKRDQGLDANKDQEMILYSGDANFNNPTTRWVPKDGSSNQTCALSTTDKAEGTGSLLITSTGAGDVTNNYVKLPFEFLEPLVAGKKYTLEGKARLDPASLSYGSALAASMNMETDPSLVDGGYGATYTMVADERTGGSGTQSLEMTRGTNSSAKYQYIGMGFATGEIAKVTCWIKNVDATSGYFFVYDGSTVWSSSAVSSTSWTQITLYVKYLDGTFNVWFCINGSAGQKVRFDDVVITKVTPITLTKRIGTKSVTVTPSISAYTKFVLNFQATGSEVSQDLKAWLSGVGNCYVDSISLTQRYDLAAIFSSKPSNTTGDKTILASKTTATVYAGYVFYFNGTAFRMDIADGVNSKAYYSPTNYYSTAIFNNLIGLIKSDEIIAYKDGIATTAFPHTVGKVILTQPMNVGLYSGIFGYMSGLIGKIKLIRFDNIDLTDFNPNTYQPGHAITDLGGGNPEVVLHINPKDGSSIANMLKDYSPKGHVITAVNIDLSNRVVVRN